MPAVVSPLVLTEAVSVALVVMEVDAGDSESQEVSSESVNVV